MNTIEWLQARVEGIECDIQLMSESIKRSESEISIWTKIKETSQKDDPDDAVIKRSESEISVWTKIKEARQKHLDDYIKIQQHLSLILDQMILAETPEG